MCGWQSTPCYTCFQIQRGIWAIWVSVFFGSALKPADKQEALQETQNIATATQQACEENTGVIRKALRYFKGSATQLEGATETALKIGGLFGI
jgi:hypothetical protein